MNADCEYNEWMDANGVKHKDKVRDRIIGTFDLKFRLESDYAAFIELIKENIIGANKIEMYVYVNNKNEATVKNFYIDYKPVLFKNFGGNKCYKQFTFAIGEE